MDIAGVATVFADDLDLLGALQLKWHTRLAGRIEREQAHQPMDLKAAVVRAWRETADELPGIRAILDEQRARSARVEHARERAAQDGERDVSHPQRAGGLGELRMGPRQLRQIDDAEHHRLVLGAAALVSTQTQRPGTSANRGV